MSLAHGPPPGAWRHTALSLEDKLPLRAWSSEVFGLKGQVSITRLAGSEEVPP